MSLALLATLGGCSSPSSNPTNNEDIRRPLLRGLGEQIFVPRYEEFEARTADLHEAAQGLCDAPSEESFKRAQDAWWAARAPWKRNEILMFGPYTDQDLRLGPKIDFWPARPNNIEAVLKDDAPITEASVTSSGTSVRGLPVVEYLLFQEGLEVEQDFATGSRRCVYLNELTSDLKRLATQMREAWDPEFGNYLGELVDAGRTSESYDSVERALSEIVNRLSFTAENVGRDKLGTPVSGGLDPQKAESRFSGRSLEDIRDNLRGIEEVCFGADTEDPVSLMAYLDRIAHPEIQAPLAQAFQDAYAALDAVSEPLTESLVTEHDEVQAAYYAIKEIRTIIAVDMISAMGLTSSFNDADGD